VRARIVRALLAGAALALALPAAAGAATWSWNGPQDVAASPDGRNVYVSGYQTLSFGVDGETGSLTLLGHTEPGGYESQIAVSPDGRFVYSTTNGGVHILSRDAGTGLITHEETYVGDGTSASHRLRGIRDVQVSRDGRSLYLVEHQPSSLTVFDRDAATGRLTERQSFYDVGPFELALSPDDRHVYAAGGPIGIYARDPATGLLAAAGSAETQGTTWNLAVAPDGGRVYAGYTDYGVYERDPATGALTLVDYADLRYPNCRGCGSGSFISVAPDGGAIFSVDSDRGKIPALVQAAPHPTEGAVAARTYEHGTPRDMAWSPDGRLAFVLFSDDPYGGANRLSVYRRTADGIEPLGGFGPSFESPDDPRAYDTVGGSISIEDGALYTNTRDVSITITRPPGVASLRLSNVAGDFGGAPARRLTMRTQAFPWRLATTGPERSVKRVYVKFTKSGEPYELFDDVVLDERPPELLAARIAGSRLVSRARDNRSGVKRIQVTTNRRKPGKARRYSTRVGLAGSPRRVHVRVFDGAGNRSAWRIARKP
jgi:DNA-binding beta-propeller fold protein YncE